MDSNDEPPVLHVDATKCKSCGARIMFAATTSGKLSPFEEDAAGLWTIENGAARYLGKGTQQLDLGQTPRTRYTSHFSSCPHAGEWRARK